MGVRHFAGALGDQRLGSMKAGQIRCAAGFVRKMHDIEQGAGGSRVPSQDARRSPASQIDPVAPNLAHQRGAIVIGPGRVRLGVHENGGIKPQLRISLERFAVEGDGRLPGSEGVSDKAGENMDNGVHGRPVA